MGETVRPVPGARTCFAMPRSLSLVLQPASLPQDSQYYPSAYQGPCPEPCRTAGSWEECHSWDLFLPIQISESHSMRSTGGVGVPRLKNAGIVQFFVTPAI